jgi:hypothetical protein
MSETPSQLPVPAGVLSKSMAYRIAAVMHPQDDERQPGKFNDDIDYEASLRQRAKKLDPESGAIHTRGTYESTEKDLRSLLLKEADAAHASINARTDRLVATYELEDKLIEEGIFTPETGDRLKDASKEEYEKKQKLVEYIREAAENPSDDNLQTVEIWSELHKEARFKRKQVERQINANRSRSRG